MSKGRDGKVPRFSVPVPLVPRDGLAKMCPGPADFCPGPETERDSCPDCPVALSPGLGPDHGDLRDGTGIPTYSRDNRLSLVESEMVKFLTFLT